MRGVCAVRSDGSLTCSLLVTMSAEARTLQKIQRRQGKVVPNLQQRFLVMSVLQIDFRFSRCLRLRHYGAAYQILDAQGKPARIVNDYLRESCRSWSLNTSKTYAGHLDRFITWMAGVKKDIRDLDGDAIAEFAFYLAGKQKLKPVTCKSALATVQRFVAWSSTHVSGALPAFRKQCPTTLYNSALARAMILPRTIEPKLPRFIIKSNAEAFVAALGFSPTLGVRNKLIGRLMVESGLRVAEVINFPVCALPPLPSIPVALLAINEPRRTATIVSVIGKGSKQRFITVPWELHKDLLDFIDNERKSFLENIPSKRHPKQVFISAHGKSISTSQVQAIFRNASAAIGIKATPHTLRHTYSTYEYYETKDLSRLSKLLGHVMLETTSIYCEFSILASHSMEYEKLLKNWENKNESTI